MTSSSEGEEDAFEGRKSPAASHLLDHRARAEGPPPAAPATSQRLGQQIRTYVIASILVQALSAATVPLYTRALGVRAFGQFELLVVSVSLAVSALGDAFGLAVMRLWFVDEDAARRRRLTASGLTIVLVLAGLVSIFAVTFSSLIAAKLFDGNVWAVRGAGLTILAMVASRFTAELVRTQGRAGLFLLSTVSVVAVGNTIAVLSVWAGGGVEAVYFGLLTGSVIGFIINAIACRRVLGRLPTIESCREIVLLAIPLIPAAVGLWSLNLFDRVILSASRSLEEVGYYGLAYRLATLLFIASYTLETGWSPHLVALGANDPNREAELRADGLRIAVATIGLGGVVLSVFARPIVILVGGASFAPAASVVPLLAMAMVVYCIVPMSQVGLLLARQTSLIGAAAIVAAGVNVVACIVLIPPLGTKGAATATLVGFVAHAILILAGGQRYRPAPHSFGRIVLTVLAASAASAGGWIPASGITRFAIGITSIGLYIGLIFALGIVRRADLARLGSLLPARSGPNG